MAIPTRWNNSVGEDEWWLEIECDRFADSEPLVDTGELVRLPSWRLRKAAA